MSGEPDTTDYVTYKPPSVPYKIDNCLDFVDISKEGSLLLGSSNLNGRFWTGSIWYFKDTEAAPNEKEAVTGHNCESGVVVGKFLGSDKKVIVGEDSGAITVLSLESFDTGEVHFVPQMYSTNHDAAITTLDVISDGGEAITGGNDSCINMWNLEALVSERKLCPAHGRAVTGIKASPSKDSPVFASSSLDGSALLWDPRQSKPASVLVEGLPYGLTSISWVENEEVIVGSQTGLLSSIDVRVPGTFLYSTCIFKAPIHSTLLCPDTAFLAASGDTPNVKVFDCSTKEVVYSDDRHKGIARGLAWHPKSKFLYTCGYDRQIISHSEFIQASPA